MSQIFPEQTIQYRTFLKRTLVEGLSEVFRNHPDELLQRTKVSIEYPKTEADYPSVVVNFREREITNAGVGHEEIIRFSGNSNAIEVSATIQGKGSVVLSWPQVPLASKYAIFKGSQSNSEAELFETTETTFRDSGTPGEPRNAPDLVTATLPTPVVSTTIDPNGDLQEGTYYYRVYAYTPYEAVKFQHAFYKGSIQFAIDALSAYDRDLVSDTLVQLLAMGRLTDYTNAFFERVYPETDLYPYSQLHFITLNTDRVQGGDDNNTATPWGAEDDLLYSTSYQIEMFGELYSLPPKITYALIKRIFLYSYIENSGVISTGTYGNEPLLASPYLFPGSNLLAGSNVGTPTKIPDDPNPWVSNSF